MSPERLLEDGLGELGITPGRGVLDKFLEYLSELKKWNRTHNLTAISSDEGIVTTHFLDSALFLKALDEIDAKGMEIADIGSGAGFPGLPVKILRPELSVTLVEPSGKKAAFLRHMGRRLGLGTVPVLETRLEDLPPGSFDILMTRALFKVADFVKEASPVLRKGGWLVMSKGPKYEGEIKGLAGVRVISARLPGTSLERHLILLKKQ